MDNPTVKGDEVRRGTYLYLAAVSKDILESIADVPLSEAMLHQLNDDGTPPAPTTARQWVGAFKTRGEMDFALRLREDNRCIGVCRLGNVSWKSRHAQLYIGIVDEAYFTVDILVDVIQTMLQFAYWEANLNRISIHCIEDNTVLHESLERAGFSSEGRLRQEVYGNGRYQDKYIYSILRREWSG